MNRLPITLASQEDRKQIYHIRYQTYSLELGQHEENEVGMLTDALDAYNEYLVCKDGDTVAGFVSITPPGRQLSLDKYRNRDTLRFLYENAYEVRILTVTPEYRGRRMADQLLSAAADYVISKNGSLILAIGRLDLMKYYQKCGFRAIDEIYRSGSARFQLMFTMPHELKSHIDEQSYSQLVDFLR